MSAKNFSIMLVGLLVVGMALSIGARPAEAQYVVYSRAYVPAPVFMAPPPVYVAPAPVYVVPRPVYVVPSYRSYGFVSWGGVHKYVHHRHHYYRRPRHHGRHISFRFGFCR
ncbi:MAG: hypothetical protein ACYTF1_06450 [Planctomycetota bacterium]